MVPSPFLFQLDNCIYHHDAKAVGCIFYHITHNCSRGDHCKFSHDPISDEQLQELKRIHEEVELEKQSVEHEDMNHLQSMPAEVAKAMIADLGSKPVETSAVQKGEEQTKLFEDLPSIVPVVDLQVEEEKEKEKSEEEEDYEYFQCTIEECLLKTGSKEN